MDKYRLCQRCGKQQLLYVGKRTSLRCKCLACGYNILVDLKDPVWKKIWIETKIHRVKEPIIDIELGEDDGVWSDTSQEAIEKRKQESQEILAILDKV